MGAAGGGGSRVPNFVVPFTLKQYFGVWETICLAVGDTWGSLELKGHPGIWVWGFL